MYRIAGKKSKNKEVSIVKSIGKVKELENALTSLKQILDDLKEKHGFSFEEIKKFVEKKEVSPKEEVVPKKEIPIDIFNKKLSVLESVVKYLKENLNLSFSEIAKQLNRNYQTIRTTYINSKRKFAKEFSIDILAKAKFSISISVFKKEELSALESLVKFLKEIHNLKYSEIAKLLKRDQRTIWTVYQRAKKKIGEINERRK